jgi:hypothetical protein
MKPLPATLPCLLLAATVVLAGEPPCRVERAPYRGWNSLKLSNGLVALYVVPELGGRVIQFEFAGHPFFFVNGDLAGKVFSPEENGGAKGGWKNYGGSKLWPAPQGWENDEQWPGPPDPVLDGGAYRGEIIRREEGQVAITVTSPPDARTGIQLARTISLFAGGTQVRHECAMRNISRRPVRWAIWEVNQHDTADLKVPEEFNRDFWAYCPLNPRSVHPRGFTPMFGQATHASWRPDYERGLLAVKYDDRVGKVGLDSQAGWLAVVNGQSDQCFVGRFTPFPGATYPDQATVEFWLNGAGEFIINRTAITNAPNPKETPYFMESEILSPLVTLQPGEEYRFQIDWFATRCPKPVVDVTSAGAVCESLAATRDGTQVKLEGVFGVFFLGQAEAVFKDNFGNVVGSEPVGPVEPNRVFRLSRQFPLPEKAFRVSVIVRDEAGHARGVLGNVILAEGGP